ncbi:FAD-dependent oxidoreductase [Nocardioides daeguensis]|uniref:Glycine oxidase ThiO n=1 Tax=Nocardioides daeguensis TaxID=908359 RepID=A0ABP6W4W1_9ACTN|nr:FAD-dependent oxidoreductase [Nocardioides daeguensis]MBV6727596.1 FAD-dependent oxidoreductase [Nocardioides daeguensis]MCR1771455.1 FAD-dependent oxidoreductase [Nocardioides daeguensis]
MAGGTRVDVLGAGIVGLTVAEELGRRGHDVVVVDPRPAGGASYAAAGMLSPAAEVWHGEEEVLRLGLASLARWPELAARLGVALRATGTLLVGHDAGDLQQVERQVALLHRHGHAAELLGRAGVRSAEPSLARAAGGALLPAEASVDPRAVCRALLQRVVLRETPRPDAEVRVVATGSSLPEPWTGLVSGVRGEILRLRSDDPPRRTVRGWVGGEAVYLVPRGDDRVVLGATSEAHAAPPVVTAGGALRLLAAARTLWPALDRAELVEATARDRPATVDGLPLVGPSGVAGVVLAAGHYRHGVLLAPLTAQLVADHLATGAVEAAVDPRRFAGAVPEGAAR